MRYHFLNILYCLINYKDASGNRGSAMREYSIRYYGVEILYRIVAALLIVAGSVPGDMGI